MDYEVEGGGTLSRYAPAQLGEPVYRERSPRSKNTYDIVVMDGEYRNVQVLVLKGQTWPNCRQRVVDMVMAHVDPDDIRGYAVDEGERRSVGGGLAHVEKFLWWTLHDDYRKAKSEREAGVIG